MSGLQSAFLRTLVLLGVLTSSGAWGQLSQSRDAITHIDDLSWGQIQEAERDGERWELGIAETPEERAAKELKNIRKPADLANFFRKYPEQTKVLEASISDPYEDYFSGQLTKKEATDGWESVVDSGMGNELLALYEELGLCDEDASEPKGRHLVSAYISNEPGKWISVFKQHGSWHFRLGNFVQLAVDKSQEKSDAAEESWRDSPCFPLNIQFFDKGDEDMDILAKEELDNFYAHRLSDGTLSLGPDLSKKEARENENIKKMQARMASDLTKRIAKMAHDANGEDTVMKITGYKPNERYGWPLFSQNFTLKGAADAMCQAGGCGKYLKAGQDMVKALRLFWNGYSCELNDRQKWSLVIFLWAKLADESSSPPQQTRTAECEKESTADLFSDTRYGKLKSADAAEHKEDWFLHIDRWSKTRALKCLISEE